MTENSPIKSILNMFQDTEHYDEIKITKYIYECIKNQNLINSLNTLADQILTEVHYMVKAQIQNNSDYLDYADTPGINMTLYYTYRINKMEDYVKDLEKQIYIMKEAFNVANHIRSYEIMKDTF